MVDALGKSKLENLRLQPPLQEIFNLQTQDVIQLHLTLVQHTDPHQTPEQGITFKQTLGVLLIQSEQLSGSFTDLGQGELDPPHLTLVPQSILANEFQLLVETGLLKGTARGDICLATNPTPGNGHGGLEVPVSLRLAQ